MKEHVPTVRFSKMNTRHMKNSEESQIISFHSNLKETPKNGCPAETMT